MFGIEEILLIPLVFGGFNFGAGWGQRAYGGIIIGLLATGFAVKTMMPGLDVRWIALWPASALAELMVIWCAVCWIGYMGGSGGWFGRRTRERRGPAPSSPSFGYWIPMILIAAAVLWQVRDSLAALVRSGGRVPGGVPMAAPPQMIVHEVGGALPQRTSWFLVALLSCMVGPGAAFAFAGLANRNMAWIALGGVAGGLPVVIACLDPGTHLTAAMFVTLAAVAAAGAFGGWRFGLAHHRQLAIHGRPTTWQWDHTRDHFKLAMEQLDREANAGGSGRAGLKP